MSKKFLLINPNSSDKTSQLMLNIVNQVRPDDMSFDVMTAPSGPTMITNETQLINSEAEVIKMALSQQEHYAGIIIGAFGDPGLNHLKSVLDIPVTGLCEAAILDASSHQRSFAIATVTPDLINMMDEKVDALGLKGQYKGVFCTTEEPLNLTSNPASLYQALFEETSKAISAQAEAVIIGGGPLGDAAYRMKAELNHTIIAPLNSAVNLLFEMTAAA